MPVRLKKPYDGQAANTLYWAPFATENQLISLDIADSQIELASDYSQQGRVITTAVSNTSFNASDYIMNSGAAQTLTLGQSGFWPIGKVITISQMGVGATTVVAGVGVTINTKLASLITAGQYSIGQLKKVGPATWLAFGGFGG